MIMRQALQPVRLAYHWLRDHAHYASRPGFRSERVVRGVFDSAVVAERLQADGVCIVERYLDGERLIAIQRAADAILSGRPEGAPGKRDCDHLDLPHHPIFANVLLDEFVIAVFEAYYGRDLCLAHTKLQRLDPTTPYEDRNFRWHHDTKGKYVKAMWLLTDQPPDGQRMSFIKGSHRPWRPPGTYDESRFTDGDARHIGQVVECAGPAGSLVLFDTNGIHRGNRNAGPRRDVLVGVYTCGRYLSGYDFDPESLPSLTPRQHAVLERSRAASPGYAYLD